MRRAFGGLACAAMVMASVDGLSQPVTAGVVEVNPEEARCAFERAAPPCSLRAALRALNAAGAGTIRLMPGSLHTLSESVGVNDQEGGSGLPSVTGEIVIKGNSAVVERSTADGVPLFRIFHISPQGRLRIRDLTIRNGATESTADGAGLWNTGTLELERVTVTGNHAGDDGGGIRNDGVLTLLHSVISGNSAGGESGVGGGLYNLPVQGAGEVTILDTVFRDNRAGDRGGAFWNSGTARLEGSILKGNSARAEGGGFCTTGSVTLVRCRIADNRAGGRAGGISALGPVEAVETTISGNSAPVHPDQEGNVKSEESSLI